MGRSGRTCRENFSQIFRYACSIPTEPPLDLAPEPAAGRGRIPPITLGQIADLAGVGPSAVSNWRKRFEDFPPPTTSAPGGRDLFSLPAVETWLARHDRLAKERESERLLFKATDILRGELDVGGILAALCSALAYAYVQGRREGTERDSAPYKGLGALWGPLLMLEPPTRVRLEELVGDIEPAAVPLLMEEILARYPRQFVETRTNDRLIELLVALSLARVPGSLPLRIYDPAVGEGGLLLAVASAADVPVELVGQDTNAAALLIARQRLFVNDRDAILTRGDSLLGRSEGDVQADIVVCDPPYGSRLDPLESARANRQWVFGAPGPNSDFAWLQHIVSRLAPEGRGYVLMPSGSLFRAGKDAKVRAALLGSGAVEAVVTLPGKVAERTAVPLALWIVRRPREGSSGRVLLVDGAGAHPNAAEPLDEVHIERIAAAVDVWRDRGEVAEPDRSFAVAVPFGDFGADANLMPARWGCRGYELNVEQRRREFRDAVDAAGKARRRMLDIEVDAHKLRGDPTALAWTSVGDLIAEGRAWLVRGARWRSDDASREGMQVLRPGDMGCGEESSRVYVDPAAAASRFLPVTHRGDIVVLAGARLETMVEEQGGRMLALPLHVLRLNEDWLDPVIAAAFLASARNRRLAKEMGSNHPSLVIPELQLPRIPADEACSLRAALDRLAVGEELARDVLTASREAREALLDLGGYVTPRLSGAEEESVRGG